MKILVIAEHDNKKIKPSTLSTISAGLKINENIEMLIFSDGSQDIVSDAQKISGLKKVTLIKHEIFKNQIAEDITKALTGFLESGEYTHILAPSSTFGKKLFDIQLDDDRDTTTINTETKQANAVYLFLSAATNIGI